MSRKFLIKLEDQGFVISIYFLGMKIEYSSNGVLIHQSKYSEFLVEDFGYSLAKAYITLMDTCKKLQANVDELLKDNEKYKSKVGNFKYLTNTRLDIAFTV